MFLPVLLSKSKFFTRFVSVALVLLVSYSCCKCRTRVAFTSLVSGTRVVNLTRSRQLREISNATKL